MRPPQAQSSGGRGRRVVGGRRWQPTRACKTRFTIKAKVVDDRRQQQQLGRLDTLRGCGGDGATASGALADIRVDRFIHKRRWR